ncbi:DUF4459 domain-containing protein [Enterobacter cloacae complex sp. ESBL7]
MQWQKKITPPGKKIYFNGKETDYNLSDFNFFGKSDEPFWGGESDEYEVTVDQWMGIYADSDNPTHWQRVIPDDSSTVQGAPWCTLQLIEKDDDTIIAKENAQIRCIGILASSAKAGTIPEGMKGTLLDYGDHYGFSPQIKNIVLNGKFPEASRTDLTIRTKETNAHSVTDLKIMLNEIYARYGYIFTPGGAMDQYFRKQPWYNPQYNNVDAFITETEHGNIKLLKKLLTTESQEKKKLYIENTTSFCQALYNNDIKYVMDNTSVNLTTGADNVIGHIGLKKNWSEYRNIMINGVGNCKRNMDSYKHAIFLRPEPFDIYRNSSFEFDEKKGKYVLSYIELDSTCNRNDDIITLEGVLIKRKHSVNDGKNKHSEEDLELKTIGLQCVAGVDMDKPGWDRYVQLLVPSEKYQSYEHMIGNKLTLQGKIVTGKTIENFTPVQLSVVN